MKPFLLERYFARHEFSTRWLLSSSDCESMTVGELLSLEPGSEELLHRQWLGYTESQGDPHLRERVAEVYRTVGPEDVLVYTGAEEAIFLFMHAALGPGDHLVVHDPCYQALREVAASRGAEVTPWRADPAQGWALDPDDLARALRPNTRAVVINCPHNPTGYLMDPERFRAVVALAERHGLYLFSDEVYRELEHDPTTRLPAACDLYERAVSLGVLSKTYGLPGLRIGWTATRCRELYGKLAALKDYTTICNSAPSEVLAKVALKHRGFLARRSLELVLANLERVEAFFARHQDLFEWVRPSAGPMAFPRLRSGDADSFCDRVREEAGVLLLPGSVFEAAPDRFRIGFGRRNLPQALEALEEVVG